MTVMLTDQATETTGPGTMPAEGISAAGSALACDDGDFDRVQLDSERQRAEAALRAHGATQAVLYAEPTCAAYAALAALAHLGIPVVLLPAEPPPSVLALVETSIGADVVIRGGKLLDVPPGRQVHRRLAPGDVVFVTSGTTGPPKLVQHSWTTLARAVRVRPQLDASVWLLAYPYHLYAGLQVLLHVWLNRGTAVLPPAGRDPEATLRRIADKQVGYISATPSFYRRLLMFGSRDALARAQPIQVTLGGERVTQDVLDSLRRAFPLARLVHIYATSELGRCFAVDDGREGFPVDWLKTGTRDGVGLRVRNGELEVRPVNAMKGYLHAVTGVPNGSGWAATGDLVEQVDDRVVFRGRRDDLINVGGQKVNPHTVEDVLRACDHVTDVRVFGHRSALVGELVAAEIVGDGARSETDLRATIATHCTARLSSAERPRLIRIVPCIGVSEAGKIVRKRDG